MAKRTPMEKFISEVCRLKHEAVDKDISNIQKNIKEIKNHSEINHSEIKKMIEKLSKNDENSYNNLKNKIVLSEQKIGSHIDELDKFDDKLKGNGKPGIWETVRAIQRNLRILIALLVLSLGGSIFGISLDALVKKIYSQRTQEITQEEINNKPPIILSDIEIDEKE